MASVKIIFYTLCECVAIIKYCLDLSSHEVGRDTFVKPLGLSSSSTLRLDLLSHGSYLIYSM